MKQTAVEFLEEQLFELRNPTLNQIEIIKQAKEMERQQIENAWKDGNYRYSGYGDSETYYEETFKQL